MLTSGGAFSLSRIRVFSHTLLPPLAVRLTPSVAAPAWLLRRGGDSFLLLHLRCCTHGLLSRCMLLLERVLALTFVLFWRGDWLRAGGSCWLRIWIIFKHGRWRLQALLRGWLRWLTQILLVRTNRCAKMVVFPTVVPVRRWWWSYGCRGCRGLNGALLVRVSQVQARWNAMEVLECEWWPAARVASAGSMAAGEIGGGG